MKSSAPLGGGLVRSICSYAAISFSHFPKSCSASAHMAARPSFKNKKPSESKATRFMNTRVNREQEPGKKISWLRCQLAMRHNLSSRGATRRKLQTVPAAAKSEVLYTHASPALPCSHGS